MTASRGIRIASDDDLHFQEKFWSEVGHLHRPNECWPWLGYRVPLGYGVIGRNKKLVSAHRLAYRLLRGPIPDDRVIDHLCRNRACCNPRHMEPVTSSENVRRGEGLAPQNARKMYCPHGHRYDKTYKRKTGSYRRCTVCHNARSAESAIRLKQKRAVTYA